MGQDYRRGISLPALRAWRRARLLTQAELARRARVARETVSAAERGQPVKITTAARLARALGVERPALVEGMPSAKSAKGDA